MNAAVGGYRVSCSSREPIAGKGSPSPDWGGGGGVGALFSQREGRDTRRADARHNTANPSPLPANWWGMKVSLVPRREFLRFYL